MSGRDVRIRAVSLWLIPIETRMPLKFGQETLTEVTCARVRLTIEDQGGRSADGWGETPLSVQWGWPSFTSYGERFESICSFTRILAEEWLSDELGSGHPIEIGHRFLEYRLPKIVDHYNQTQRSGLEPLPWLAGLISASAFDIALHDAYGVIHERPTYSTYHNDFLNSNLSEFLESASSSVSFGGHSLSDFLDPNPPQSLPAWHLVGGKDPVSPEELTGDEPTDGYPVLLRDWIRRDGLTCLKVKLRGNDAKWDQNRLRTIGKISEEEGIHWLSADFNCTVEDPRYVNDILDQFLRDDPKTYGRLLYVEQPFPYDLESYPEDVHSVSARKPLFMDESAHDWRLIRLGRSLGWTGVALKTCKTQTGALLSLCWAKAHGMTLMVQDLTNPMLAQIPHVQLAAHATTIMGVETNGMQFYPNASAPEAVVHPGLYQRRGGTIDRSTLKGPGFGYRIDEIQRTLPEVDVRFEK